MSLALVKPSEWRFRRGVSLAGGGKPRPYILGPRGSSCSNVGAALAAARNVVPISSVRSRVGLFAVEGAEVLGLDEVQPGPADPGEQVRDLLRHRLLEWPGKPS